MTIFRDETQTHLLQNNYLQLFLPALLHIIESIA